MFRMYCWILVLSAEMPCRTSARHLQLDAILAFARLVKIGKPENRSKQQKFKAMLVMKYECLGIGTIKLLVGIRHKTLIKVQYCITALEVE